MSSVLKIGQTCLTAEETYDLLAPGQRAKTAPRPLSLRSNFSWTLAGNVVYAGCQWGMLMILAKLGSPERVGQFALGLAVTAPVIMLTNLHLRAVQATDARREYRFGHYLALRLATTALALLATAGIACGYRLETALVILAVGLSKTFESLSDVVYGLLQAHERMDRIALSMMIKGPLSLVALGATVYLTGSIVWGALALAGGWGLLLVAYDIPNGIRLLEGEEAFRPRWDIPALARLARLALPLGIVMMLISLNANIPRYFIEHELGERELGIFAALAYLILAGNTVVGALGQSASPRLARYYAEGDGQSFKRLLGELVGLGAGIGVAGLLVAQVAGRLVLTILYKPEYADHTSLFTWLMLAATVSYVVSILGYAMTAARYFRPQLPLAALCVAVSTLACYGLVPRFGLRGAAWAGLVSLLVQLAGSVAINFHALRARVNQWTP
ncbi:MAG: oligosaccharide flippase family protein [Isosphaeraceae bacterium]|jgi:O-antigen/teichoic acid export membrane protein